MDAKDLLVGHDYRYVDPEGGEFTIRYHNQEGSETDNGPMFRFYHLKEELFLVFTAAVVGLHVHEIPKDNFLELSKPIVKHYIDKMAQDERPALSALAVQEGGNHYKDLKIQPWQIITANGLDFFEGNVVKYVMRHKSKNGIEDLKKAKHYLDYMIEELDGKCK